MKPLEDLEPELVELISKFYIWSVCPEDWAAANRLENEVCRLIRALETLGYYTKD